MISERELQEIEAVEKKATPLNGWEVDTALGGGPEEGYRWSGAPCPEVSSEEQAEIDAAFAVRARAEVPRLIAEIRELRASLSEIKGLERERCAKVCKELGETLGPDRGNPAMLCMERIRGLGAKPEGEFTSKVSFIVPSQNESKDAQLWLDENYPKDVRQDDPELFRVVCVSFAKDLDWKRTVP